MYTFMTLKSQRNNYSVCIYVYRVLIILCVFVNSDMYVCTYVCNLIMSYIVNTGQKLWCQYSKLVKNLSNPRS